MDALGFRVSTAGVGSYRVFFSSNNYPRQHRDVRAYDDGCGYVGGRAYSDGCGIRGRMYDVRATYGVGWVFLYVNFQATLTRAQGYISGGV